MFCGQVFGPAFLQLPLSGGMCSNRAEPVFSPHRCQGMAPSQVQRMLGVDLGVNVPWHIQKMLDSQKFCCTNVATWAFPFSSPPWPPARCPMPTWKEGTLFGLPDINECWEETPGVQVCVSQDVERHLFCSPWDSRGQTVRQPGKGYFPQKQSIS